MKDIAQKEFDIFIRRLKEEYPLGFEFIITLAEEIEESWNKISPSIGKSEEAVFGIEDGVLKGNIPFWLVMAKIAEVIIEGVAEGLLPNKKDLENFKKKILKEARKVATTEAEKIIYKSFEFGTELKPIECKNCGHLNPFEAVYCNKCGKKL